MTPNHDPPTYEEAMRSLGRAPTQQDLGHFSPVSVSSSLVPYEDHSPDSLEGEHNPPAGEEEPEDMGEDTATGKSSMPQDTQPNNVPNPLSTHPQVKMRMKKICPVMKTWKPLIWPPKMPLQSPQMRI